MTEIRLAPLFTVLPPPVSITAFLVRFDFFVPALFTPERGVWLREPAVLITGLSGFSLVSTYKDHRVKISSQYLEEMSDQ